MAESTSHQKSSSLSDTVQVNAIRRAVTRVRANSAARLSPSIVSTKQSPSFTNTNQINFYSIILSEEQRLAIESPLRFNRTPLMNVKLEFIENLIQGCFIE